jgi:hypothetical protein
MAVDSEIQTEKKNGRREKRGSGIFVDGTIVNNGSGLVWLWVVMGPKYMRGPALATSKEINTLAAERLILGLAGVHRKHPCLN